MENIPAKIEKQVIPDEVSPPCGPLSAGLQLLAMANINFHRIEQEKARPEAYSIFHE